MRKKFIAIKYGAWNQTIKEELEKLEEAERRNFEQQKIRTNGASDTHEIHDQKYMLSRSTSGLGKDDRVKKKEHGKKHNEEKNRSRSFVDKHTTPLKARSAESAENHSSESSVDPEFIPHRRKKTFLKASSIKKKKKLSRRSIPDFAALYELAKNAEDSDEEEDRKETLQNEANKPVGTEGILPLGGESASEKEVKEKEEDSCAEEKDGSSGSGGVLQRVESPDGGESSGWTKAAKRVVNDEQKEKTPRSKVELGRSKTIYAAPLDSTLSNGGSSGGGEWGEREIQMQIILPFLFI